MQNKTCTGLDTIYTPNLVVCKSSPASQASTTSMAVTTSKRHS